MPDGPPASAVVAVNCLHWIDPDLRFTRPHALLRPGGVMVIAGCKWARPTAREPFWAQVQEDYRAVGFAGEPPPPAAELGPEHFPPAAAGLFTEVATRRYPFDVRYSAADHLANLATQSGTHALGEARGAEFLARVRHRLDGLGWPALTRTFVGYLTLGRRR